VRIITREVILHLKEGSILLYIEEFFKVINYIGLNVDKLFYIVTVTVAILITAILVYYIKPQSKVIANKDFNDTIQIVFNKLNKQVRKLNEDVNKATDHSDSAIGNLKYSLEEQQMNINTITENIKEGFTAQTAIARTLNIFHGKITDFSRWKDEINRRISRLENRSHEYSLTNETIQIPRGNDIVIAKLTPTEMKILRILATSGPKTASEIREVTGKTREHSARLMKKLYLERYVERDTLNMPYSYKLSDKIRQSFEFSQNKVPVDKNGHR